MFEERRKKGCRSLALSPVSLSRTRTHKHMRSARTAHTPHEQGRVERPGPSNILSSSCGSGHCLDPCLSLSLSLIIIYAYAWISVQEQCRVVVWVLCSSLPAPSVCASCCPAGLLQGPKLERRTEEDACNGCCCCEEKEGERERSSSFLPSFHCAGFSLLLATRSFFWHYPHSCRSNIMYTTC